jgi:AcrR family transcriptional regulator
MKSDRTKENIIQQTIALIRESNGAVEDITIRGIAQRAGVGVGLVNHYFQSKDHLIEVCVQTIIGGVIRSFRPELPSEDPLEVTKVVAKQVMDFLMDNQEVSRVSILGDMKQPAVADNTMKTVAGFAARLSGGQAAQEHRLYAFMITAVLQCAFLRKETLKDSLGVDFYDKQQRDSFIDDLVERFG